jgi:hypothetical protein
MERGLASVVLVLGKLSLMGAEAATQVLELPNHLCRNITNFQGSLNA